MGGLRAPLVSEPQLDGRSLHLEQLSTILFRLGLLEFGHMLLMRGEVVLLLPDTILADKFSHSTFSQAGHYIVMLDASDNSNGKNNILAVDPSDIFQIIKVQTRFGWVWVTSYDTDSSTYQVMWRSSEGSTRTANLGHYDFIIPNGTVVT